MVICSVDPELGRAVVDMSTKAVTAEQEYAKNPDLKKEDIEKLQEWAATKNHLPKISEEQMILFYHSCYWDMEATKSCIDVYYTTRASTPEFFRNRDLSLPNLQQGIECLYYGCLPVKDPNGYQIIFHGLKDYDSSKYVFADGVKLLAMAMEACATVEGTIPGYICLFDMKGVRLSHITRLSYGQLRKFFHYIQEGLPIRLKAFHVVNTLPIIDKILFMIKPFMKKELLQMLHLHSGDFSEVQKYLPKECLPSDFGGELKSVAEFHEDYIDWMKKMTPHFLSTEIYSKDAPKEKSKKKEKENLNLSSLCID
ncbi:CRAL/TRIO domain [Nesidiocoris tenuis]|uniref:CRAL/TRIO domain n=1 Tax=Nesidiocoris tenuis TaxID=355587 RepID=A0ABN7B816_9HEMI|nr:CRAL/TRIO domain [Nesidiocoris tenuis]